MGVFNEFNILDTFKPYQTIKVYHDKGRIKGNLTRITFKDKDTNQFVEYCPSFDISGYGDTKAEAIEMIKFSLADYFEYLLDLPVKKAEQELIKFGWSKVPMHNKEYSNSHVDIESNLKNFNAIEDTVEVTTIAC
jgi:hypothetical protein